MKIKFKCNGKQFHEYQQNEYTNSHLKSLNTKQTTTYLNKAELTSFTAKCQEPAIETPLYRWIKHILFTQNISKWDGTQVMTIII